MMHCNTKILHCHSLMTTKPAVAASMRVNGYKIRCMSIFISQTTIPSPPPQGPHFGLRLGKRPGIQQVHLLPDDEFPKPGLHRTL